MRKIIETDTHTHAFAHGGFMDLEKEIELLKEKVALLEKVKELQDLIGASTRVEYAPHIPYIPTYPTPSYPPWTITWGDTTCR